MKRLLLAALLMLASTGFAEVRAAPLRLCYEDVPQPPWSQPDGSGLNFDLLRTVAQRLNEQFTFLPKPWKRCFEELRWGDVDGVIGAADSPERRAIGVLPTLADGQPDATAALNDDNYYVFIRANSGASWDGRKLVIPHGAVIVPRSYSAVRQLKAQGYPVDEIVKSPEEAFRLLADGKADVTVLFGKGAVDLARTPRFSASIVEAALPYTTQSYYLLASHVIYSQDPKRIEAIWDGIREVRASAEYRKLEKAATEGEERLVAPR